MGRCSRWHKAKTSLVMEESDRMALKVTDQDKMPAGKHMPDGLFESWSVKPSLGEDRMNVFRGTQTWAH